MFQYIIYILKMNDNLLRLIYSHKKCDLSDSQILSILLGMGVIDSVAKSHIEYYNNITKNKENSMECDALSLNNDFVVTPNLNKTNESTFMKNFNVITLYENIAQSAKELHELSSSKSNASYSAISAYSVLENALSQFPGEVSLMIGRKNAGLPIDEKKINPTIKYNIAESVFNMLNNSFLTPAKTLCAYIATTFEDDKWGYVGARMMNECSKKVSNNMYASLYEQLQDALNSKNIYEALKEVVIKSEFWCNESKQVVSLMENEKFEVKQEINNTVASNNNFRLVKMFSPVVESEDGSIVFNLYGKNYKMKNKELLETHVKDNRYNDVVNGLSLMSYNSKNNTLDYYGVNGKVLEFDLTNEQIKIGNSNLSNLSSIDLRDNLNISGLFNKDTVKNINTLVKMFEAKDIIAELDNCINLNSELQPSIFLTLISVEEGFYVNSVDYTNLVNEMRFFETANETRNYIKDAINYDATNILKESLKIEGDKEAKLIEKRTEIQERIDFLKTKRGEVISKIESLPENINSDSLTKALNLIECEIKDNELQLNKTFQTNCYGKNCVPVKVCNLVGTLKPGDVVYVDAAMFASAPDFTTLSVTDPKTGASVVVNKADLLFDINHNSTCANDVTSNLIIDDNL